QLQKAQESQLRKTARSPEGRGLSGCRLFFGRGGCPEQSAESEPAGGRGGPLQIFLRPGCAGAGWFSPDPVQLPELRLLCEWKCFTDDLSANGVLPERQLS